MLNVLLKCVLNVVLIKVNTVILWDEFFYILPVEVNSLFFRTCFSAVSTLVLGLPDAASGDSRAKVPSGRPQI